MKAIGVSNFDTEQIEALMKMGAELGKTHLYHEHGCLEIKESGFVDNLKNNVADGPRSVLKKSKQKSLKHEHIAE